MYYCVVLLRRHLCGFSAVKPIGGANVRQIDLGYQKGFWLDIRPSERGRGRKARLRKAEIKREREGERDGERKGEKEREKGVEGETEREGEIYIYI